MKVASLEMAGRSIPGSPWAFANDMRKMINNKEFRYCIVLLNCI